MDKFNIFTFKFLWDWMKHYDSERGKDSKQSQNLLHKGQCVKDGSLRVMGVWLLWSCIISLKVIFFLCSEVSARGKQLCEEKILERINWLFYVWMDVIFDKKRFGFTVFKHNIGSFVCLIFIRLNASSISLLLYKKVSFYFIFF